MIRYIFTGEEGRNRHGYIIPRDATHVSVHESVKVIPMKAFFRHPNIVELICHDGVIKIENHALYQCPSLRRVLIRGVKVVEQFAFWDCEALEYVECPELETIGEEAFNYCKSLSNFNLPSAKIVDNYAFNECEALAELKFGKELEFIKMGAFMDCRSLERITLPLKNGLFTHDDIFQECANLRSVDLVEGTKLYDTAATLILEDWRDDMNAEIDSIDKILPRARAGVYDYLEDHDDAGEKALVIREWIARVLRKIIRYKVRHRFLLNEASSALQLALPNDIVTKKVVPFLELPLHAFDGEDSEDDNMNSSDDGSEYASEEDDGEEEYASINRTDEEEQHDHGGGRKRRKTANGDEESVDD